LRNPAKRYRCGKQNLAVKIGDLQAAQDIGGTQQVIGGLGAVGQCGGVPCLKRLTRRPVAIETGGSRDHMVELAINYLFPQQSLARDGRLLKALFHVSLRDLSSH